MNRKFEIVNLFWGVLGLLLLCVFQNGWGTLPAVGLAVTNVFFIRRESSEEELSMEKKKQRRTLNIISLVCWGISAALCYFYNKPSRKRFVVRFGFLHLFGRARSAVPVMRQRLMNHRNSSSSSSSPRICSRSFIFSSDRPSICQVFARRSLTSEV